MPRALLIGLGGCGSRMVDALNRKARGGGAGGIARFLRSGASWPGDASTLVIDTDRASLSQLEHTPDRDVMHLAKDISSKADGRSYFREAEGRLLDEACGRGHFDVVFIFVGGGGFTGSPFAPPLGDSLANVMDCPVYCVLTLPFQSEGEVAGRAVEALKELWESAVDCVLLVDNSYVASGETSEEFPRVNDKLAGAVYRLLEVLETPMISVADMGDLKSALKVGSKIGTLGLIEDVRAPVDQAIRRSLGREGLLFPVDVYNEGGRAYIVMDGPKERFSTERLKEELGNLSTQMYHVFKGIIVSDGPGMDVLSVVSLRGSERVKEFATVVSGSSIGLQEVEEF